MHTPTDNNTASLDHDERVILNVGGMHFEVMRVVRHPRVEIVTYFADIHIYIAQISWFTAWNYVFPKVSELTCMRIQPFISDQRNKHMLKPGKGGEYFFDRNGS
jgi:hypothetical protein